jgi:NADH-quinone oxidoreductase subunit E
MSFSLTEKGQKELEDILSRYPNKMAACIPVLQLIQHDLKERGEPPWLPEEAIAWTADLLQLSTSHVFGVATFYSLLNTKPVGRNQVWVCRTLSCALNGADGILEHCEKRLGIKVGETTPDGEVTLWTAECLASCGTGPMMQVNREYHENLSTDDVDVILDRLRS